MRSPAIGVVCLLALGACGRFEFGLLDSDCRPNWLVAEPYANSDVGGDGETAETAFSICTARQLAAVAEHPEHWARQFRLAADLDLSGVSQPMIGDTTTPFTGVFDGGGHTISNLVLDHPTEAVGLFVWADGGARIANLTLSAVDITGDQEVGALIGQAGAITVDAVFVDGRIVGNGDVGGVIGNVFCGGGACLGASITNVVADVDVVALTADGAGGICGIAYNNNGPSKVDIVNVSSSGSVTGTDSVGGIVGESGGADVDRCSSSAIVNGLSGTGGLVGVTTYNGTLIQRSSASGDVTCTRSCGGLSGSNEGTIMRSHATGRVMCAGDHCGGLAGDIGGDVIASYASGEVSGVDNVGGLVGLAYGATVADSYATGAVSGRDSVGGVVGYYEPDQSSSLVRCYSTSSVAGAARVGGLTGEAGYSIFPITITDSFATGAVIGASAANDVSPAVGFLRPNATEMNNYRSSTASCSNTLGACSSTGTVAAELYSGTNEPLTRWDFVTTWELRPLDYPAVRAP